jgi:cyclic pyranopterin phosphate synthase
VGFAPLKLNVVVIPGVNDGEILDLAALTLDRAWHVRFIEFMPIGNSDLFQHRGWIPSEELRQRIRDRWGLSESTVRGNGPADVFPDSWRAGHLGLHQPNVGVLLRSLQSHAAVGGWLAASLLAE